jgi:predicted CxxxxCH...CXXCH cytochrome family protein
VHGTDMELQRKDCRGCHGINLEGATGPSCDGCHSGASPTTWRSNCTFCHGGGLDQTGAPPRDLGSSITNTAQSFVGHRKHVAPTMMSTNDCTTCHTKPTDVMSPGHAFDATAQAAEVNLTLDGRNPGATYNNAGTCSNLYCHGNGRTNGTAIDGNGPMTCGSCHGSSANRANLSTYHRDHHGAYACAECHNAVISTGSTTLTNPALHINKVKDIKFLATGFTMTGGLCSGTCHGTGHTNFTWQ